MKSTNLKPSGKETYWKENDIKQYIHQYITCTDEVQKDRIYTDHLHEPLYRLAEGIFHRIPKHDTLDRHNTITDCVTKCWLALDKIDLTKNCFSYLNMVCKNAIIRTSVVETAIYERTLSFESLKSSNGEEDTDWADIVVNTQKHPTYVESAPGIHLDKEFISALLEYWKENESQITNIKYNNQQYTSYYSFLKHVYENPIEEMNCGEYATVQCFADILKYHTVFDSNNSKVQSNPTNHKEIYKLKRWVRNRINYLNIVNAALYKHYQEFGTLKGAEKYHKVFQQMDLPYNTSLRCWVKKYFKNYAV